MPNMLLVEDDELKLEQVQDVLTQQFPSHDIVVSRSYQSALEAILSDQYDIIILDMSLPTFDVSEHEDGGRPQGYAGREILRQMDRRRIITPVIILTQFDNFGEGRNKLSLDEIDLILKKHHSKNYIAAIFYSSAIDDWKTALYRAIKKEFGIIND